MNIIFFTQAKTLEVFYQLYKRLKERIGIKNVGFYVTNAFFYEEFLSAHPDFEERFMVLKEWEIYRESHSHIADMERIRIYENKIGDPVLWGPVVTDRRLYMGGKATFRQDYKPKFSYESILAIMDIALQKIDHMFKQIEPDLVCTIYTATFGDCLGHLFAKARGIRSFDLRLARLKNYVMFVDGVEDPPPHIIHIHENFEKKIPDDVKREAEDYITTVLSSNAMYEGVVPSNEKKIAIPGKGTLYKSLKPNFFHKVKKMWNKYQKSKKDPYCFDYSRLGIFTPFLYKKFLNPLNLKRIKLRLKYKFISKQDLNKLNYILYPLHTEPELVLSQFARPFLNQIEVIRNISLSMPIGMTLLVKEHPMMLGRRSFGFYKKILEIPNVKLVDFDLSSESVLENARMVIIIRGAVGLEAVLRRKPVVSLGKSLFDILPRRMFGTCHNLYELPDVINDMLNNYHYDHDSLIRYLASVVQGSAPVNLISDLLGKKGRFRTEIESEKKLYEEHPHFDILTDYLYERIVNVKA